LVQNEFAAVALGNCIFEHWLCQILPKSKTFEIKFVSSLCLAVFNFCVWCIVAGSWIA